MPVILRLLAIALLALPTIATAQSTEAPAGISLELNAVEDVEGACRFTFVAHNETSQAIDKAVFETVIFDAEGAVVRLALFDFRELPDGRLRVRQFDVSGMNCNAISQALINGTNSCVIDGVQSTVCSDGLSLSSRITIKLLG
ncbi:hypothetical protein BXY66_0536 [Shimia isoporae]|uniref:Tat pathway signal sequence domain protein n=1 Tax=Shimia isoporae TaxID=647720 RepID=A0A4R1NLC5_9RHOB|nr:hypothetical protein [Shimia isoporae]TCL08499.1 hypothetical protein BXY66_0536 [Shimia isoporae]